MKINSVFEKFDKILIKDDLIYYENVFIGLINPSSRFTLSDEGIIIVGANGYMNLDLKSDLSAIGGLVASGVIIPGDINSAKEVKFLLSDPRTSRTVAYFLCTFGNLSKVNSAIKNISKSKIAIIGCGGIGSACAYLLAGAGIKDFIFIDYDTIEKSNLNRQVFWRLNDIGRFKVDVLKESLLERFPDGTNIDIEKIGLLDQNEKEICNEILNKIKECDLIVITADTPTGIHEKISAILAFQGIPIVGGGYQGKNGLHYYINKKNSKNFKSEKKYYDFSENPIAPSYGPMNFEVASLISNQALNILTGNELTECEEVFFGDSSIFPRRYYGNR